LACFTICFKQTIFPIGKYQKTKIREIAAGLGLKSANTPDSQEICFVPNDDYRQLIEIRMPEFTKKINHGDIVYKDKKVGNHTGYINYTIGQRRGLNLALGKPIYVTKIDADNNVIVVDDAEGLNNTAFITTDINLMTVDKLTEPTKAIVKIRYKDKGNMATLYQEDDKIKIIFDEAQKAITPGQSAVFYDGENVIGGGIINNILY